MKGRHPLNNQQGFTLIEIIAVLVLLGILAAVAVPKYMDLQKEALKKSAAAGNAEIQSRLSRAYSQEILKFGGNATLVTSANMLTDAGLTAAGGTLGDYTYGAITAVMTAGSDWTWTITAVQGTTLDTAVAGKWTMP